MHTSKRLAVLALVGLALARPAASDERTKPIEQLLPADTLVLATIHDVEEFRADFQKTGLYKIWADPEISKFVETVWGGIEPFYAEWEADIEKQSGVKLSEVWGVLRGELSFAFTGVDQETGMPGLVFTVEARKNLPAAIQMVQKIREKVQAENPDAKHSTRQIDGITIESFGDEGFKLHYAVFADGFYFATTEALIDGVVNRFRGQGDGGLAGSGAFQAVKDRLTLESEDYLLYADTGRILETFGGDMPEEAKHALENAGISGWKGLGIAGEFTDDEWRESMTIYAPDDRKGISVLFKDPGQLDLAKAKMVPASAESFMAFRFLAVDLWDELLATVERFDPSAGKDMKDGVAEFEKRFNVSVRNDLLASLGGETISFGYRPEGGGLFDHAIQLFSLKDAAKFEASIEKLLTGQELFEARTMEYQGRTIRYLLAPVGELGENPFENIDSPDEGAMFVLQFALGSMAWYVEDGWLVTSNLTQSLFDYIDHRSGNSGSLADNPEFQAMVQRSGSSCGFVWSDMRSTVSTLYNTGLPILRAVEGFARRAGVAMDTALLPRSRAITAHLTTTHYVARVDSQGVTLQGSALLPGTLVGLMTGTAVAGMAIPAILSARVEANEAAAMATLKTLTVSQEQLKMQGSIDADGDGSGEYGFVQELAGTAKGRSAQPIDPPFVSPEWGKSAAANGGMFQASGYWFQIHLPGKDKAVSEAAALPQADKSAANGQEAHWVAYAWPVQFEKTGRRVFVINESGQLYETHNYGTMYSGTATVPPADAAYDLDGQGNAANLETGIASGGGRSGDGNFWTETYR